MNQEIERRELMGQAAHMNTNHIRIERLANGYLVHRDCLGTLNDNSFAFGSLEEVFDFIREVLAEKTA